MANKRTIEEVLDIETGQYINAYRFFEQPEEIIFRYRRILMEAIHETRPEKFVCFYCRQKVKINGGLAPGKDTSMQQMHFAHQRDSDECEIKTAHLLTREEILALKYNGAKESLEHKTTKKIIGELLLENERHGNGVSNIIIDQFLKGEKLTSKRRKPDVRCQYKTTQIVFEIQLSTTFLSVIAEREYFYSQEGVFIMWIFRQFNTAADAQLFTEKDILYSNYQNVFVLDDEAISISRTQGNLILRCYYNEHQHDGSNWSRSWKDTFVSLADLKMDAETKKIYYYREDEHRVQMEAEFTRSYDEARLHENALNEKFLQMEMKLQKTQTAYKEGYRELVSSMLWEMQSRTSLIMIFYENKPGIKEKLKDLFLLGYKVEGADHHFLEHHFDKALLKADNIVWRLHLEDLCVANFFAVANNITAVRNFEYLEKTLFAIYSLKYGLYIGLTATNINTMVADVLHDSWVYTHLFIQATRIYAPQLTVPKNHYYNEDSDYDEVFKKIFPDLYPS